MKVLEARASKEKEMENQAEGTGDEPIRESGEKEMGNQVVRIGDEPVHKAVAERTEDEPVHEPVLADVEMGIGDKLVHDMRVGDSHFEDYPGDDFEKVGEFTPKDTSQSPSVPTLENPVEETPASTKPRRKRFKTLACLLYTSPSPRD